MYTPTRRGSISESTYRFTPSKRGQAALDALALGYDVQLPDYSLALLPRSAVSEQALASVVSTSAMADHESPLSRSSSYIDSSRRAGARSGQGSNQQHPNSEIPDRRRFARQGRSPRTDPLVHPSTTSATSLATPTTQSSSVFNSAYAQSSASSRSSNTSRCTLANVEPTQGLTSPTHQEKVTAALASLYTPRSMPRSPPQLGHSKRHLVSRNQPHPSRLLIEHPRQLRVNTHQPYSSALNELGSAGTSQGYSYRTHSHSNSVRSSPIRPITSSLEMSPYDRSSKSLPPRIYTDSSGRSSHGETASAYEPAYLEPRSGGSPIYATQTFYEHEGRSMTRTRQQPPRSSMHHGGSMGSAHQSPVYQTSKLPMIGDPSFADTLQAQRKYSNSDPSTKPRHYNDYAQHSQYATSPPHSAISVSSPHSVSARVSHHGSTQSLHEFPQPHFRNKPLPRKVPTASSSSSHTMDFEDEAFRVHPERAAMSRMESLLMLSACRYEVEDRHSGGGRGTYGHEDDRFERGAGFSAVNPGNLNVVPNWGGLEHRTYNAREQGHPSDTGGNIARTPPDAAHRLGFQARFSSINYPYILENKPGRQRSGSMHVFSPQRHGPPPHGLSQRQFQSQPSQRYRQRSTSLNVQGLSSEAVKKLRAYETLKDQEEGREGRLTEMVGIAKGKKQVVREIRYRKSAKSPQESNVVLSFTTIPITVSPTDTCASSLSRTNTTSPSRFSPKALVPLPPSPLDILLPQSPAQVPLPPSPLYSLLSALPFAPSPTSKDSATAISPIASSELFIKYRASQGIQSPRPTRTRQNTASGRTVPIFRLTSSPEKVDRLSFGPNLGPTELDPSESLPFLKGGLNTTVRGLTIRTDNLKPDPNIERILTPPPSFWSPPPLSVAVRTSGPLLPAASVINQRTPLRPMSVPPGGITEDLVNDMRRAWSCELAIDVGSRTERSFAGDWNQCMVIDVSDEEEEGSMVTDKGGSESESELEVQGRQMEGNEHRGTIAPGIPRQALLSEGKSEDIVATVECEAGERSHGNNLEHRRANDGVPEHHKASNPGSAGAHAVVAVQNALVKLAMDNAGITHEQRIQLVQNKPPVYPPLAAPPISAHPARSQALRETNITDPFLTFRSQQLQATINTYFDAPGVHVFHSDNHAQPSTYPKSNVSFDSLRSGLEQRVAASANAVEEAVRARSASPSLSARIGRITGTRSISGSVLPPRLQRLQAMQAWPTQLSMTLSDIPALVQDRSSSQFPARQLARHDIETPVSPSALPLQRPALQAPTSKSAVSPKHDEGRSTPVSVNPRPTKNTLPPLRPQSQESAVAMPSNAKRARPAPLTHIAEASLVNTAPATAPLARTRRTRHQKRQSATMDLPNIPLVSTIPMAPLSNVSSSIQTTTTPVGCSVQTPIVPISSQQPNPPDNTSTKPRPKGRRLNRSTRSKKKAPSRDKDLSASDPSSATTLISVPFSGAVPALSTVTQTPTPPSTHASDAPPPTGIHEAGLETKIANKRKNFYQRSKRNKPSTSTLAGP